MGTLAAAAASSPRLCCSSAAAELGPVRRRCAALRAAPSLGRLVRIFPGSTVCNRNTTPPPWLDITCPKTRARAPAAPRAMHLEATPPIADAAANAPLTSHHRKATHFPGNDTSARAPFGLFRRSQARRPPGTPALLGGIMGKEKQERTPHPLG